MPANGPPIGAHVSIAGGIDRAIERGQELGCEAIQIFVKSPNRWRGPVPTAARVEGFRQRRSGSAIGPAVAHAAYLINLAATDRSVLSRSRAALAEELERCDRLGLDGLIVHPGAHLGAGEAAGIERVADSLRRVLGKRPVGGCPLLLEITAGQGTVLGHRLEQLAEMRALSGQADRIGVCVDTCHAFAAGYPIHRARGYNSFFRRLEDLLGLSSLGCVHLNDSRTELGTRRDRHANLGEGTIGTGLFRRLLGDRRLRRVPMVLETPLGADRSGHARDLAKLRRWRERARTGRRGSAPR